MKVRLATTLIVLLIPALALAESRVEAPQSFPLSAGGSFSLENINGSATIEGYDGQEVVVEATKEGRSGQDLDDLKINIEATANRVAVETEYPRRRNSSGSVEYRVKVPRGTRLEGVELVNGDLTISGIEGPVECATVNGSIKVSDGTSDATIETVNGSIEASFHRLDANQRLQIESVNGKIDVRIPSGASADVSAETVNGRISNDFGVAVEKGEFIGSSMEGRIGSGGTRIQLETVNGRIHLGSN